MPGRSPHRKPGHHRVIERIHAPLRSAYNRFRLDKGHNNSPEDFLILAFHTLNSTTGPERLCPILLVFGTMSRTARTKASSQQLDRSTPVENALAAVQREQSKRRLVFCELHPKGPKATKISKTIRNLPAGSPVLVHRIHEHK